LLRTELALVEPDRSVAIEEEIFPFIQGGLRSGDVKQYVHLSLPQAIERCVQHLDALGDDDVDVLLCRFPDFSFRCRARAVAGALQSLIELDGDTVTMVSDGHCTGVVIDVETESTAGGLYEVDVWEVVSLRAE
jgi:hypothetical protein